MLRRQVVAGKSFTCQHGSGAVVRCPRLCYPASSVREVACVDTHRTCQVVPGVVRQKPPLKAQDKTIAGFQGHVRESNPRWTSTETPLATECLIYSLIGHDSPVSCTRKSIIMIV